MWILYRISVSAFKDAELNYHCEINVKLKSIIINLKLNPTSLVSNCSFLSVVENVEENVKMSVEFNMWLEVRSARSPGQDSLMLSSYWRNLEIILTPYGST